MTRRKKKISELADDKLPKPINIDMIEGKMPRINIRLSPKAPEIIAEAKKRGLKYKDGKFSKRKD